MVCTTNHRSILFGYLLHLLVQRHQGPLLFLLVSSASTIDDEGPEESGSVAFITEEVDGVGDKESGDTKMVKVQTLLEASLENFETWDYFPQLPKYQDCHSISTQITGMVLYYYKILLYLIVLNSPHSEYYKM